MTLKIRRCKSERRLNDEDKRKSCVRECLKKIMCLKFEHYYLPIFHYLKKMCETKKYCTSSDLLLSSHKNYSMYLHKCLFIYIIR
jgi:hypothetical protein